MKKTAALKIIVLLLAAFCFIYLAFFMAIPAAGCIVSGGKVTIEDECSNSSNFPNTCNGYGACAPQYRTKKIVCGCERGQCFDGGKCVTTVTSLFGM